jgi:hypothetical protein
LGNLHRGKFTHLLNDIRQVGVTGPVAAEDLNAEDIKLVLAGVAGGQSEFQAFDEFKRGMNFKLRTGRTSVPEENADNPDFFIRNEYRKAWKAEAAGLRKMSRIAAAAQVAPFLAIGASAAVGSGLALAEAGVAGLVAKGVPYSLIGKWVGSSLAASSVVSHFGSARDEARAAGVDPNSVKGVVSTASAAFLRGIGIGDVAENLTNTSMQTGQPLNRSPLERVEGGFGGALNMWGLSGMSVPEAPGGLPAAAETAPSTWRSPLARQNLASRRVIAHSRKFTRSDQSKGHAMKLQTVIVRRHHDLNSPTRRHSRRGRCTPRDSSEICRSPPRSK